MEENATCEGEARWRRGNRRWLGYDLAVWCEHGDDESNWGIIDDLHRSHGGTIIHLHATTEGERGS